MRYAIVVLLALRLSLPVAAQDTLSVRLIYISSPGEGFTPETRSEARTAALDALQWWYTLAPSRVAYGLEEEREITVEDPFNTVAWMRPYVTFENEILEIYIIANHQGKQLLYGQFAGYAAEYYRAMFAVTDSVGGTSATIAHELGHVLYGLPDWYETSGLCKHTDIMCYSAPAYQTRFIGCLSLDYLGKPCERNYIPLIVR